MGNYIHRQITIGEEGVRLKKRRAGSVVAFLVGASCIGSPPGIAHAQEPPSWPDPPGVPNLRSATRLEIGTPAPDFVLPVLDQAYLEGDPATIRLSDLRGRHVIVNFWAVRCAPCVIEHPELTRIWKRFESRGLSVFGLLSPSDSPERALAWSERNDPDGFPTLVPPDRTVGGEYEVSGIPHTYIIGPDGLILYSSTGWTEEKREELIRALDQFLPVG